MSISKVILYDVQPLTARLYDINNVIYEKRSKDDKDLSDHREISLSNTAFDVLIVAEKEFEVVEDVQG